MCRLTIRLLALGLAMAVLTFPLFKANLDLSVALIGYAVVLSAILIVSAATWRGLPTRLTAWTMMVPTARAPYLVFAMTLLFRVLGIVVFQVELQGDHARHELAAWNLSAGLGYVDARGPDAHYPPGYVFFAAVVYAIFGRALIALSLANCVLEAVTALLVYRLAGRAWGEFKGRLAAVLYAVNPALIITTQMVIYVPLLALLLSALCLVVARRTLLVGVLLGAASLVKPITLIGPGIVAVVDLARSVPLSRTLSRAAAVALVMLAVIAPWTLRNFVTFDRIVLVSSNGGWVLWWGNNPDATGKMLDWTEEIRTARGADLVDLDRRLGLEAFAWIADNPWRFLALIPVKQADTWGTEAASLPNLSHRGRIVEDAARAAVQLFYVMLALTASVSLFRNTGRIVLVPEALAAALLLLASWLIHSVYIGWSFYHLPFLPLLTALAAGGFVSKDGGER